jgi:hypothetical protein
LIKLALQIRDGKDTGLGGHDGVLVELMEGLIAGTATREAESKNVGGNTVGRLGTLRKGAERRKEQRKSMRRSMFKRFSKLKVSVCR